ncbi:sulfotransferase family cytosolic 1B member 1-like [Pollicipes pollicipes]|uniref:sulfotransferase family cytosolic 1B member 1-like n=1 Tax=Pollicipes pollicipes TaxID=41117 RepID=UPI001884DA50|nr:sulfotransferase family cytosolic 1B member 1-like [Pollicipes pollicipes]
MASSDRKPFPFKILQLENEIQKNVAQNFRGFPNGLASCNHWGHKLSATVTEAELEDLYNYPLDPRDVWVVTPPKCGTTWTQEMVWLIANDLDYEGAKTPLMPDRWNYIEFAALVDKDIIGRFLPLSANGGLQDTTALTGDPNRPSPRFIKTHLPMCMNNPRLLDVCKVVYVARNPKDICVSYYHHCKLFQCHDFTGDLELFVENMINGSIMESKVIDHMIEAWNLRHHPNMCFLFFEDMKHDLKTEIRRVAKFLGKSYSDEQVEKLAHHLHIDNFKNNPYVNREDLKGKGLMHADQGNFVRKGKTGDWKNYFTPEMNAKVERWMADKMRGTDLRFVQELDRQD